MPRRASRLLIAGFLGSLSLIATSCGSEGISSSPQTSAVATSAVGESPASSTVEVVTTPPTSAAVVTVPTTSAAVVTVPPAATAGGKVNINSASTSDLEKAFDAAGVTNARRWAREVDEYRPYPEDPDFGKLRQELGKYNISPAVLVLIIATLEY